MWALFVMVAGAVLLAVGLLYANSLDTSDPISRAELDRMDAAASAAAASDAAATPKRVAFLGDSYTAGTAAAEEQGFADVAAAREGWTYRLFGQGGTGFTNPGQVAEDEATFGDRVPDVVAYAPDLVIVQGGTNDHDAQQTEDAAAEVLQALHAGLPDATILVVGPVNTPIGATTTDVRDAISAAATANGAQFIDAWDWVDTTNPTLWAPDAVHPTTEGHAIIADRLAAEVDRLAVG